MGKTSIEWTEYSWNPLRGVKGKWHCTKVSPGCANCYAERVNHRFGGPMYTVGADTIRLDEKVLTEPLQWRKPRMVFVCSMTDLFHEDVADDMIDQVFAVMRLAKDHTFQVLTKRPERAAKWFSDVSEEFERRDYVASAALAINQDTLSSKNEYRVQPEDWPLPNVWLGVSCENQEMADKRIPILLQIPAAVRWVSAEPLLGPIDLWKTSRAIDIDFTADGRAKCMLKHNIDWLVAGGESGPAARPCHPDWPRSIRDQCAAAGVPFFWKQWGEYAEPEIVSEDRMMLGLKRVGKKLAGRTLDGRTWDGMPR